MFLWYEVGYLASKDIYKRNSACKFSNVFERFFFALKVNMYLKTWIKNVVWWDSTKKLFFFVVFCVCAVCLLESLIMHVPISKLHAQWHWCLQFSMSLISQGFLQCHPTVILVNSCFIIYYRGRRSRDRMVQLSMQ